MTKGVRRTYALELLILCKHNFWTTRYLIFSFFSYILYGPWVYKLNLLEIYK